MVYDHLEGISFRSLADKYDISKSHAWDLVSEYLQYLPDNNQFTARYCEHFSHIFVFDGKYIRVKGYERKIALLWGVDYFRHDIPIFTLAPAETYASWARFFSYFRILSHHPELIACDDHGGLKLAAKNAFPATKIQTCHNHFKENIRSILRVRSDAKYREAMLRLEMVLGKKLSESDYSRKLFAMFRDYRNDIQVLSILTMIEKYKSELLAYRKIKNAPITTNLIEGMNAHLEQRLFKLQCFESFKHARLWINAYILKRRMTKWKDCKGKFKHLNGKTGVEMTKKDRVILPTYF